jgi:tRNA pseudouridine55 synthase
MTGPLPGRGASPLSGILNVDKPLGISSHAVVVAIRKLLGQRKVGHAGTLDPLATGVLLVCLGKATRVSQFLMDSRKTYHATVRLGISTTTHDAEGEVLARANVNVGRDEVQSTLRQFVGRIDQVPPAYSAIKVGGRRLYDLARRGIPVQVASRKVDVYRLEVIEWNPPTVMLIVECGPGTYVRALARDLGETLGCGAYLTGLRRTQSGQFTADQSVSLPELEAASAAGNLAGYLHPLDAAFAHLPAVHLGAESAYCLALGQAVPDPGRDEGLAHIAEQQEARAYAPGGLFVALVVRDKDGTDWRPRKVFVEPADVLPPDP